MLRKIYEAVHGSNLLRPGGYEGQVHFLPQQKIELFRNLFNLAILDAVFVIPATEPQLSEVLR